MGNKIAVTDNGEHKIGKKIFLTDDKLVHRKAKKMFRTQNGVFRTVYSSGVRWAKYSCDAFDEVYEYQETDHIGGSSVGDIEKWGTSYLNYCTEYTFDKSVGFCSAGNYHYADTAADLASASGYIVTSDTVFRIVTVSVISEDPGGPCLVDVEAEIVALCDTLTYTAYRKGSENFGIIEAEDSELPENGELVEGSPNDSYCILDVDGTYYYYVRGE